MSEKSSATPNSSCESCQKADVPKRKNAADYRITQVRAVLSLHAYNRDQGQREVICGTESWNVFLYIFYTKQVSPRQSCSHRPQRSLRWRVSPSYAHAQFQTVPFHCLRLSSCIRAVKEMVQIEIAISGLVHHLSYLFPATPKHTMLSITCCSYLLSQINCAYQNNIDNNCQILNM